MTTKMKLTAGLDVGNGYLKGLVTGDGDPSAIDQVDIPSGVAVMTRPNSLPEPDDRVVQVTGACGLDSFYNQLDVSFTSPMVPDSWRRLFGVRGLSADGTFDQFDVVGRLSKAEQPLSKILVLGVLAAKALKDYVAQHGAQVPADEVISVSANVALALPITEYMAHRVGYAAEFKAGTHTVTIHTFETPVTVKITVTDVQVIAEGASAQYAITAKGEPLMEAMLADVRSRGTALDGITAQDVLEASSTIGVDIGEGTVNFPVFSRGAFNPDASTTFHKGYGSVLTSAIKTMEDQRMSAGFTSRKQLAAYLQEKPSALRRSFYETVRRFTDQETEFFAREVAEQLGRVLSVVGAMTEVVYVYGGGAGSVKETLYPLLMSKVAEMNGADAAPVLYLDASYSRHLNREGLFLVAQRMGR